MMTRKTASTSFGVLIAIAVFSRVSAAAVPCETLVSLSLPYTTITSAQTVAAGAFTSPGVQGAQAEAFRNLPAFCRVTLTVKPTSDSDIKMEVWMPVTGWNGNFEANGTGGIGGAIPLANLAQTLRTGYATAGSDTGHTGDSRYALDHPEKVIDFGYRSAHEMNMKARAVIAAYYGNGPRLAFIDGCGGSAQTASMSAQRYPADYNGIAITGFSHKTRHALWQQWVWDVTHKDAASNLSRENLTVLHNAVLNACDSLDGVKDGVLENPAVCRFDPKVVECRPGADGSACLTTPQVEAVRKIYAGATNSRTGQPIYFPPAPGSELTWAGYIGPEPFGLAADFLKYFVFKDPNWDPRKRPFNWDSDMALAETPQNLLLNGNNPDIREFVKRDGKLLLYEGWNDGTTLPGIAIDYYKKVVDTIGAERARDSVRLFMVPGMTHCQATADSNADWHDSMVKELEKWIQTKRAPDQIIASSFKDGKAVRTRPLCPYPQVASYKGTGSTDDAANFTCKAP